MFLSASSGLLGIRGLAQGLSVGVITVEASSDQFPLPNVPLVRGFKPNFLFPIYFPLATNEHVDALTIIDA